MGDLQHFCLRWNNYQNSITTAFENLRDDEDFIDVTLACDGKSLKAHRVVLSACSPYFRELLKVSLYYNIHVRDYQLIFLEYFFKISEIYGGRENVMYLYIYMFIQRIK